MDTVNHVDTESGLKVQIVDTGLVLLQLRIRTSTNVDVYFHASKLAQPLSQWAGGGFNGEHRDFVISQADNPGVFDKSVSGAWTLAAAP